MPRKNSENGPSGGTRIFNLILAGLFCLLVLLSAVSVIRKVLAKKPVSDTVENNDVLIAQFEMKDAEEADDGDSDEEIVAQKVAGSIVFVSDGTSKSIGAVISDNGYIVTDLENAVSVEDHDGASYEVRKYDADLPDGLYLIKIDTDSAKAMPFAESKVKKDDRVYVFSSVSQGFIVKACTVSESDDYLVLDKALPEGISVIVDSDGELIAIGLPENSETDARVRNSMSKLRLFAAAAENRE